MRYLLHLTIIIGLFTVTSCDDDEGNSLGGEGNDLSVYSFQFIMVDSLGKDLFFADSAKFDLDSIKLDTVKLLNNGSYSFLILENSPVAFNYEIVGFPPSPDSVISSVDFNNNGTFEFFKFEPDPSLPRDEGLAIKVYYNGALICQPCLSDSLYQIVM